MPERSNTASARKQMRLMSKRFFVTVGKFLNMSIDSFYSAKVVKNYESINKNHANKQKNTHFGRKMTFFQVKYLQFEKNIVTLHAIRWFPNVRNKMFNLFNLNFV